MNGEVVQMCNEIRTVRVGVHFINQELEIIVVLEKLFGDVG